MALIYFAILTPISLVIRVTGKDLIGLKFSKKVPIGLRKKNNLEQWTNNFK